MPDDKNETALSVAPHTSRNAGFGYLTLFVSCVLMALTAMTALSRSLPPPAAPKFDSHALTRLSRVRPKFVLLGNSMVDTRFDEGLLRRLLERAVVMGVNGSKSAVWYLSIKNLIVPSGSNDIVASSTWRSPRALSTARRGSDRARDAPVAANRARTPFRPRASARLAADDLGIFPKSS